jgi:hypothetical protein
MQYVAQAQREIAKLNPSRHGRLINQLQSEVIALQGRRGDTKVAHVTPGEVVIPKRLQTPELLSALHAAARQAGIDPSRLVVGSRRNSRNPQTGQAEFYYNGPDIGQDTTSRDQPVGRQAADLYVNYFPEGFNPPSPGHIGIGVNTNQTEGFYPGKLGVLTPLMQVPGIVKRDDLSRPHETLVIPTSKEEDKAIQQYIR